MHNNLSIDISFKSRNLPVLLTEWAVFHTCFKINNLMAFVEPLEQKISLIFLDSQGYQIAEYILFCFGRWGSGYICFNMRLDLFLEAINLGNSESFRLATNKELLSNDLITVNKEEIPIIPRSDNLVYSSISYRYRKAKKNYDAWFEFSDSMALPNLLGGLLEPTLRVVQFKLDTLKPWVLGYSRSKLVGTVLPSVFIEKKRSVKEINLSANAAKLIAKLNGFTAISLAEQKLIFARITPNYDLFLEIRPLTDIAVKAKHPNLTSEFKVFKISSLEQVLERFRRQHSLVLPIKELQLNANNYLGVNISLLQNALEFLANYSDRCLAKIAGSSELQLFSSESEAYSRIALTDYLLNK